MLATRRGRLISSHRQLGRSLELLRVLVRVPTLALLLAFGFTPGLALLLAHRLGSTLAVRLQSSFSHQPFVLVVRGEVSKVLTEFCGICMLTVHLLLH